LRDLQEGRSHRRADEHVAVAVAVADAAQIDGAQRAGDGGGANRHACERRRTRFHVAVQPQHKERQNGCDERCTQTAQKCQRIEAAHPRCVQKVAVALPEALALGARLGHEILLHEKDDGQPRQPQQRARNPETLAKAEGLAQQPADHRAAGDAHPARHVGRAHGETDLIARG